jgi:hypothetical protein
MPAYLYRPGTVKERANYRYAIVARNQMIASQYTTHVLKLYNRISEGKDTRTAKQQYEDISTIGVEVPRDWEIPTVYIAD